MSDKQKNGLILAAVIFVVTGVISVLTNAAAGKLFQGKDKDISGKNSFDSFMSELNLDGSSKLADMPTTKDFIAVVPVRGTIQGSTGSVGLNAGNNTYDHQLLLDYIDKLIDNSSNKGIILRLDTPGGTVYEADELYLKLLKYKEETGRPIWAYMESQCCSGGVYVASAADTVYANRITTTGSIGVIISAYDLSGLYEKLGVKEVNIVSAKNKDMGSAGKPMTDEQKAIYQGFVDEYYERFVGIVAEGRKMSVDKVKELADGRVYTASQAEKNGLIDGIKASEEFDAYVKDQSGVDYFYEPKTSNYLSGLLGSLSKSKEKSESEVLVELMHTLGSGVPMYYAEPIGR